MDPRSQARVIQFLDEENSNDDEDDEDENEDTDEEQERAGPKKDSNTHQPKLKAPNFNSPRSNEDDFVRVNPYKSPAPLLPAAELEAGWSMPGPPISQRTTPLPSRMNIDVMGKAESPQSPSLFTVRQKTLRCMHIYSVMTCSRNPAPVLGLSRQMLPLSPYGWILGIGERLKVSKAQVSSQCVINLKAWIFTEL